VRSCENYFEDYLPSQIFNSDQSGFNYEIHSGRTLDFVGVKSVEGVVQSISSTTHSYTIQPTISADGNLLSPLFVALQEPDGKFGPRVEENLFQAPNIYVTASRSGKLTKEHLIEWFKNVYFANTPDKSIILVDSWTTYNDRNAIEGVKPAEKNFDILKIPPKTTSLFQPLDVYFFRTWKNFVRKFSDRVVLDALKVNLHQRNNILKLQSLAHNQFSSPRFKDFIKFIKSVYLKYRPENFQNPVEYCFNLKDKKCTLDGLDCFEGVFIVCSWCEKSLCFNHFFNEYHYCTDFHQ
jgi:hypothetical protein